MTTFSRRKWAAALAPLLILASAGCAPTSYTAQAPRWEDCSVDGTEFLCTTVSAPLDWENPDARAASVDIAIVKAPATSGSSQGAVFVNPGGPGESGVDLAFDLALDPTFEPISRIYDLVGFDPRGVGESTLLDCDDSATDADPLEKCAEENAMASYVGTISVAHDMELLRQVLGYQAINYLGYSYGTVLGATYAHLFPDRVERMVLDSAETAEWASPVNHYDQQVASIVATRDLAARCPELLQSRGIACPFTSKDTFDTFIDTLDQHPLRSGQNVVDGQSVVGFLNASLYANREEQTAALETVAEAATGDPVALTLITSGSTDADVDLTGTMISCLSAPATTDPVDLQKHIEEVGVPQLLGGAEVAEDLATEFAADPCEGLPTAGSDYLPSLAARTKTPILVVGITLDNATPYQRAVELTDDLGNAELLTLQGIGHTAAYSGKSACIDQAVTNYLLNGQLPPKGAVCQQDE